MDANIQSAMLLAQSAPVKVPAAIPAGGAATAAGRATVTKSAKEFESVFISQFLGSMFAGVSTDGPTGGGEGEEMFRSLMIDQYGQAMEARGGFGLADAVQRQLLKHQESAAS